MSAMPETHLVAPSYGPRPAGRDDECFYCQRPVGELHDLGCVLRLRRVVVRMTVEFPVEVPDSWTAEDIEFHRNEGTWCATNVLPELEAAIPEDGCLDDLEVHFNYVREA